MNYGEEIVFTGGINSDDEARVVPKGDYRDFHYCRLGEVSGKGFCVVTSQGTKEVFNDDLEPNDKILGGAAWEKQNAIVYFVYKSVGDDEIWKYDIATETHDLVISSAILNFSPDWPIYHANIIDDILKWTDGRWEDTHYMYNPSTGGRVFNPPFQINIQKALDSFYSGINNELRTFDAVKWPMNPPSCAYGTDSNRVDNKLRRKLFKFMVQPIYENGETGVWSMYSNLPIPTVNELVTGTNWLDPKTDNVIYVRFNTGPKNITKINVAVQQFDETSYGAEPNFGTFLQLNKVNDGIGDNVEYTVSFYGDAALSQIADLFKNYDRLPIEANCQEFLPTNQLTYVNFREGFEKITIDAEADYNKTYIDYSPTSSDIFIAVNPSTNNVESPAKFEKIYATTETFRTELNSFSFSVSDTYTTTIYICEILGQTYDPPLEFNVQYTISQNDYNTAIAVGSEWDAEKWFLEKVISTWCQQMSSQNPLEDLGLYVDYTEVTEVASGATSLLIGGKYYELEVKKISDSSTAGKFSDKSLCGLGNAYYNANPDPLLDPIPVPYNNPPIVSLRPNGVVTSLKKGARHQFGIVYGDRAYRDGTVYTSSDMEVFVKWPSNEDRSLDALSTQTNERPYYVSPVIRINHQPPIWATKYWIVARQNTQVGDFGQFALTYDENGSPAVTTESDGKFRVYLDNYYENNNLGATINYQIKRGDIVRFLWKTPKGIYYGMDMTDNKTGDILYYTDYIELEVLDYDPGEAGGRQSIYVSRMNKSLISSTNKFYSILIEIYRPQPAVMDNDVFVSPWRDITQSFDVGNPHLDSRYHIVPSLITKFLCTGFTGQEQRNYIHTPINTTIEVGSRIKIFGWTGTGANHDVYITVTSTEYPNTEIQGGTYTKIYFDEVFYENTQQTLTYLTAPYYSEAPRPGAVVQKDGNITTYGFSQELNPKSPAEITPHYGDVFMRQRIYGTGVSINSLQLEEGAEPALYVNNVQPSPTTWPYPGGLTTNVLFSNVQNVYPAGAWVQVPATTTSQGQAYYEVQFPGDYTFNWQIKIKNNSVSNPNPDGWIRLKKDGQNLTFTTLDTISSLPTSYTTYSGTTTSISLLSGDKVSLLLERTDIDAAPEVYALAGQQYLTSTSPAPILNVVAGGNWTDYLGQSSQPGIVGLTSTSGSINNLFLNNNSISSTIYAIAPVRVTINSNLTYAFYIGGNFNQSNSTKFLNFINEQGSNASGYSNPFSTIGSATVKSIEAGQNLNGTTQFVYVGGLFDFGANNKKNLLKLSLSGSVQAFNSGTGPNGEVRAIKIHQKTGETIQKEVLIGGKFTTYNGTSANRLVVLKDNRTNQAENGTMMLNEYACVSADLTFNGDVNTIEQSATTPLGDIFFIGGDFTQYTTRIVRAFRAGNLDGSGNFLSYSIPNNMSIHPLPFNNKSNATKKYYDTTDSFNDSSSSAYWQANATDYGAVYMTVSFIKTGPSHVQLILQKSVNSTFSSTTDVASQSGISQTTLFTWYIGSGGAFVPDPGYYYRVVVKKQTLPGTPCSLNELKWEIRTDTTQVLTGITKNEDVSVNRICKATMQNYFAGRVLTPAPDFNNGIGSGPNGPINVIKRVYDTQILVGGDFTSWNGDTNHGYLVSLNTTTGAITTGWVGPKLDGPVYSITAAAVDASISGQGVNGWYVGGNFSYSNSTTPSTFCGGVAKILVSTGDIDTNFVAAGAGSNIIQFASDNDCKFEIASVAYDAADVAPAPTTMYWYIEDRHYSDFWKSDVHNVGRFRLEDPNAKTVHRKASAIHSDSLIFGTQVNGLSSFGLDNQNIVDLNPVHGEIVRCITSGREGKTLKCLQPNKENSIYIQFYPNEVGDTSNLRVSDKTFSTWFDYKSLFGTTEAGGVALLPDGTTIYFDPIRGAFIYSDMNGQRVISETSIDSQVDYKFRTKTKELAKKFKEQNGEVRTYVNEKMGEVGFAFRFEYNIEVSRILRNPGSGNNPVGSGQLWMTPANWDNVNFPVDLIPDAEIMIKGTDRLGIPYTINYNCTSAVQDGNVIIMEPEIVDGDFVDGTNTIEMTGTQYVHVVWDYIRERWRSTYDYNAAGYLNFGQTLIGWNSDNEIYLHNDPTSIDFHGKTDWMQKITFVANEQPNVLKRFQNITLRSDKAFDVTAESTSNYNYGIMETEMPSSMFVFYEGYGKSYYRKNKNTIGQPSTTLAMINGEDMRGDALTHTLSFEPSINDKSRTLFSVGISGVLS